MRLLSLAFLIYVAILPAIHASALELDKEPQFKALLKLDARYALEVEDPYHRPINFLSPVYTLWANQWQDRFSDFWSFLEQEQAFLQETHPDLYDPHYRIAWLNDEQRANYEAFFHEEQPGLIRLSTIQDGPLADGKWMFVLLDNKFYIGKEIKYQFHHVSLTAGKDVSCAGALTIKNGLLTTFSLKSGHYRPTIIFGQHCLRTIRDEFHLDLSQLKVSYYSFEGEKLITTKVNADEFLAINPKEVSEDPPKDHFLIAFEAFSLTKFNKAELFLTPDGELFAGSRKMDFDHPLCVEAGPFLTRAKIKLDQGKIHAVKFRTPLSTHTELEKIKLFVESLTRYGVDLAGVSFSIIKDNNKIILTAQDILQGNYLISDIPMPGPAPMLIPVSAHVPENKLVSENNVS